MGLVSKTLATGEAQRLGNGQSEFSPVPGDAFVMLYQDGTGHIGFVLRVVKANATAFNTLEGNCGNRVKVGCRQMDQSILWDSSINILRGRKNREAGRPAWSRPTTAEPKGRAKKSCAVEVLIQWLTADANQI